MYAFRCKNCGHLHQSGYAGELPHPAACCVCGCGVLFRHQELSQQLQTAIEAGKTQEAVGLAQQIGKCDPSSKKLVPDNWEVLADAAPERLKELGLTPEQVERHEPFPKGSKDHQPQLIAVTAYDGPQTSDKTK